MQANQTPNSHASATGYSDADWRNLEKRLADTRDMLRDVLHHLRKVLDNLKMAGEQYKSAGRAWRRATGHAAQGARTQPGRRPTSPSSGARDPQGATSAARASSHAVHEKFSRPGTETASASAAASTAGAAASRATSGRPFTQNARPTGQTSFSWSARPQTPGQGERFTATASANPWQARTTQADDRPRTVTAADRQAEERARQARENFLRAREAQAEKLRQEAARQEAERQAEEREAARKARFEELRARQEAARLEREREAKARQQAREQARREFEARQAQARREQARREQARRESSRVYTPGCGAMTLTQACALLCVVYPCTVDDIKSAYRKQARRHHPDLGGDEEMMKSLNQAYELALSWCSPLRGKPASSWAA